MAVLAILVAASLFGLVELDLPRELVRTLAPGSQEAPAESSRALEELRVAPAGSMSGYSREKFPHWGDAETFGWKDVRSPACDVRDAALIRDGSEVRVGGGCDVLRGRWRDPYGGATYSDPSQIDIDHVVPLANAWRSGAASWTSDQRELFANDPSVVLSVEAGENRSKGDKGPEAWKPPVRDTWCDYARLWISIKSEYDLSVTQEERAALQEMLSTCRREE